MKLCNDRIDEINSFPFIKRIFYLNEEKRLLDKMEEADKIVAGYFVNYALAWIAKNEKEIFDHINKEK